VDECGTHTSPVPIYGFAPKGERLRLSVPHKRGKNTAFLSSMTLSGMGPSLAVEGATTTAVFEAYVDRVLAPSLGTGQMVVMNKLGATGRRGLGNSSRIGPRGGVSAGP
jgi:hypothetical protein